MSTLHTPGPWTYSTSSDGWSYSINIMQAENAAPTPDYSDVCFKTCCGERQAIQEANARLIAAAPDLLEALREIEAGTQFWDSYPIEHPYGKAKAAIAKATGKA